VPGRGDSGKKAFAIFSRSTPLGVRISLIASNNVDTNNQNACWNEISCNSSIDNYLHISIGIKKALTTLP